MYSIQKTFCLNEICMLSKAGKSAKVIRWVLVNEFVTLKVALVI